MATPPLADAVMLEAIAAVHEHGSISAAARSLGMERRTLSYRYNKGKEAGLHLSAGGREAMQRASLNGAEIGGGYKRVYDEGGRILETVRWSAPKAELELATVLERVRDALDGLKPAESIPAPETVVAELCTVYCLADMHIGQRSWARETGVAYDTDIAVARLRDWVGRLVAASPASREAVILDVGDTTHHDDNTNLTPRSKHSLDVDSRYFRTVEETIAALSDAVELTLAKHQKVTLVILEGNHSPHSSVAIMFGLAERYRLNPRVEVRKEPGAFWAHQFGRNMLAAAHGDKSKPERLVMFMSDEYAEMWGQTRHRFLWTGHFHSAKMQDIGGVKHEQLRAMASRDAYAYSSAYVARSQLQAITLHTETGELQRSYVGL